MSINNELFLGRIPLKFSSDYDEYGKFKLQLSRSLQITFIPAMWRVHQILRCGFMYNQINLDSLMCIDTNLSTLATRDKRMLLRVASSYVIVFFFHKRSFTQQIYTAYINNIVHPHTHFLASHIVILPMFIIPTTWVRKDKTEIGSRLVRYPRNERSV